jgi:hypothetical protein
MNLTDLLGLTKTADKPGEGAGSAASAPVQKPIDLSSLLAISNPLPSAPEPSVPAPDIRKMALDKMEAAGQLAPGAAMTMPERPEPRASGAFSKIAAAGPKPRKKLETEAPSFDPGKKTISTDELLAGLGVDPQAFRKGSRVEEARRREGVGESPEFFRIRALPRRPMDLEAFPDLTERYKRPGGTMRLRPVQSASLHDAEKADGLLGPIGCGRGKALTTLLLPTAMKSRRAVLLVPPQLKRKALELDIPALHRHWQINLAGIRVIAYSELSNASCAQLLDEINPDLIVADECHNLRHKSAARTKRFLRFMKEHPACRFAGLSGTITKRSIKDYQHLAELALRKNSPIPCHWGVLEEWAEALDVPRGDAEPMRPGALLAFCSSEELEEIARKSPTDAQEFVRRGFRRRLIETQGVVATEDSDKDVGASLTITGLHPMVPAEVKVAIEALRNKWEIDGDELVDPMSVARVARELAGGFFYRWVWPNGVKDLEWLKARSDWNKELRQILKLNRKGLDSPLEVIRAILAGKLKSSFWEAWASVKDRPEPPTEAVWLSEYLVDESKRWAEERCSKATPGIIWYSWTAFGERLAKKTGFPLYGPGTKTDPSFADPKKEPVIICSLAAHGTGKDLQKYCRNLMTTPPGGAAWEQGIARTHRSGQTADEVTVEVFLHTLEMQSAWDNACADARYVEDSQGQKQRILYADKVSCGEGEGFCF